MKLRKILAGFLAGAIAMGSMVVTSVTASAASAEGTFTPTEEIVMYYTNEDDKCDYYELTISQSELATGINNAEAIVSSVDSLTVNYTSEFEIAGSIDHGTDQANGWWAAEGFTYSVGTGSFTLEKPLAMSDGDVTIQIKVSDVASLTTNRITIDSISYTATYVSEKIDASNFVYSELKNEALEIGDTVTITYNSEKTPASALHVIKFGYTLPDAANETWHTVVAADGTIDNSAAEDVGVTAEKSTSGYITTYTFTATSASKTTFKMNVEISPNGTWSDTIYAWYSNDVGYKVLPPTYSITTSAVTNGSVAVSLSPDESATEIIEEAAAEESVNIFFKPNAGYEVASYKVVGDSGDVVLTSDEDEDPSEVTAVSFTMPEEAVTITVTYAVAEYDVTVEKATNGTITASSATAKYNDEITITATPAEGYELASVVVKNKTTNDNITVTDNKFKMPADDVTISATFAAKDAEKFALTLAETTNGTVKLSAETATAGTKITVTATPATGYEVYDIIVKGTSGKTYDVSAFTFEMPAEAVTVTVTFEEQEVEEEEKGFEETKTLVDEAAKNGTVLKQTATFDDVEAVRYTKVVSLDEIKKASKATFSFKTNDGKTGSYTTTKFYSALGVSGSSVNAPEGYGFLSLTVINIPDGVELTCTSITLS